MKARTLGLVAVPIALTALALLLLRAPDRSGERGRSTDSRAEPPALPSGPLSPADRVPSGLVARAAAPEALATTVAAGEERESEAARLLRLRVDGRVLDLDDRPIEGAEVRLVDGALVATADAEGALDAALEIAREVPGGPRVPWIEFLCSAPGRQALVRRFDVTDGAALHLGVLRLGPGGDVVGRVLDEAGAPLANARVGWRSADAWPEDEEAARFDGIEEWRFVDDAPEARTDAGGGFWLRGVPEGELFVVASGARRLHAWSDVFVLRAGDRVERTLVLARDPRHLSVRGRVLDPERRPVAGASVAVARELGQSVFTIGSVETDATGSFVLQHLVEEDEHGPVELVAWDPDGRFAPSEFAVATDPLELVLAPAVHVEVHLVDASGAAVPWGHVRFLVRGWDPSHRSGATLALGREGRGRFSRPRGMFDVEAFAPGWRNVRLGPFAPEAVKEPIIIAMTSGDAVRGRVMAAGRPVAGARVAVRRTRSPEEPGMSIDIAPLDRPFVIRGNASLDRTDATTDREGRFTITLHADGWHSVAVVADGFPATAFGPFEWTRSAGFEEVELALEPGGAIEGRLLVAPGRDPAGRIVGASNGWAVAWTAVADAAGRFRIEGLAPGPYQVRPCLPPAAEIQPLRPWFADEDAPGIEITWDCEVRPGATTHHDLDLREEEDFVLAGRFGFDGAPALWTARLLPREGARSLPLAVSPLAGDGRFELRLSRGGPLVLELRSDWRWFRQDLDLAPGRTEWSAEVPLATLDLRGAPPRAPDGREQGALHRWSDGDGLTYRGGWYTERSSGAHVVPVPAGRSELVFAPVGEEHEPTGTRPLDLAPGSRTLVDLAQPR